MNQNLPWIDSPFFAKELAKSNLTNEEKELVKKYANDGYIIINPGISEDVIDSISASIKDPRIQDAWVHNENVKAVASSPAVMHTLSLLYQRQPFPFQTLNFAVGTQQDTHSDMIHFNSIPQRFMCGVWVAFEDILPDNGPLHYYPGSHKLPFYDMIDIGIKASENINEKKAIMVYAENYTNFIKELIVALNLKKEVLNIKKGQAIIWSSNLLHGGEKIIRPGATRHSQVTHYYFEDCMYYVPRLSDIAINKVFLSDLTNIATGEKVKNTYFGEPVKPRLKLHLQRQSIMMLHKVAHLFPKELVTKVKSFIQ